MTAARPTALVTGASGFIGRATCAHLVARGFHVRAASRRATVREAPHIERVRSPDLAAPFDARELTEGCDVVVHLAGLAHTSAEDDAYAAVNVDATRRLAAASRATGVGKFVLMSSVRAQTGPAADVALTEAMAPRPSDGYGRSKLLAEAAVADELADASVRWAALRPVLVYGPGVGGNMATLFALARSGAPLPFAALKARRSLLSLVNLSDAIAHALVAESAQGVFLVADDDAPTIAEIVAALRDGLGRPRRLFAAPDRAVRAVLAATGRGDAVERLFGDLVVDAAKLKATGWRPIEATIPALKQAMATDRAD